jgi:hypothetical protein
MEIICCPKARLPAKDNQYNVSSNKNFRVKGDKDNDFRSDITTKTGHRMPDFDIFNDDFADAATL